MATKILTSKATEELNRDLGIYSVGVNRRRAVADRKDGLKLVHRRIIWAMYDHIKCINHTVKSARITGDVIGTLHSHSDTAVYGAMVNLATWFNVKVPLIIGQGNFGTIQGDEQAAMRYTEAKLSPFALECVIGDLREERNVVDYMETFDNTDYEPEFFPVKVPLLLINGTFGIGYGLKVEIPSHNLIEVIDKTIELIHNPNAEVVLIPDHCMNVDIIDTNFKTICNKGRGNYSARGIIDIEETGNDINLVIKSVPDSVSFAKVLEDIELLAETSVIQVADMREETEKGATELRYVIQLKKGSDPRYVRDILYKRTKLEESYSVNFEVLDGIDLVRMSYKSYLQSFIDFRKDCKLRYYYNKLQSVDTKYHEKDAFIKALSSGKIDEIIQMIRTRKNTDSTALIEDLITMLDITDLQAKYIIGVRLERISEGYLEQYIQEANKYMEQINYYTDLIVNEDRILEDIIVELNEIKAKYGEPRKCKVISMDDINDIPVGEFKIVVTENNFIKKIPANFDIGRFKDDKPKYIINGCNTQAILLFDELGKAYRLPIHEIFASDKNSNGIDVRRIIKKCTSDIICVLYEPDLDVLIKDINNKFFMTVLTAYGNIKKMDLSDFNNIPKSGILYTKLSDGDIVKSIGVNPANIDIVVYDNMSALRMNMNEVPHQRRNTKGMRAMQSNITEGMSIITPDSTHILVVTNKGYVNKIDIVALPISGRNRPGNSIVKLVKGDSIYKVISVGYNDTIMTVTTNGGKEIDLDISQIETLSSVSKGNRLLKLNTTEMILSIDIK